MIKKILVPLDGSPSGEAVLPEIEPLASKCQAEIVLLKVMAKQSELESNDVPDLTGPRAATSTPSPDVEAIVIQYGTGGNDYLSAVARSLTQRGLKISTVTRHGKTAESILSFAREEGVDLIAMSSRARSRASKVLRGSVPEKVMRESKVPVILTKPTPAALAKAKLLHYQTVMAS